MSNFIVLRQGYYMRTGCICPGPRFNIKMTSYQYRKSHCGDKTVVRSSYLHNGISYTGKMTSLYWIRALALCINKSSAAMWDGDVLVSIDKEILQHFIMEDWYHNIPNCMKGVTWLKLCPGTNGHWSAALEWLPFILPPVFVQATVIRSW